MSGHDAGDELVIGGTPRVNLLPPEVKARHNARIIRRRLTVTLAGVVVVVGAGVAGAWWEASGSQAALKAAQDRTTELLAGQAQFAEVRHVQEAVETAIVAQRVGASTEIDWKAYLDRIRAVLPVDVIITSAGIDSASPLAPYAQPTVPLQPARVATVTLVLSSPGLPAVPEWLEALKSLPGYADATPSSITLSETGAYDVHLTLHVSEGAYSNRFTPSAAATEKE